jgi:hypothetical protein
MPCSATSLVNLAAAGKYAGLSDRDLKLATLYALCASPASGATAQTLINGAYAAGYDALSDRLIEEAILAVTCMISSQVLDSGLATLAGGTVTVPTTSASATNPILLTYFSLDGSSATISYGNVVPGTSFTINSSNSGDTNMVAWAILKP